MGLSLATWLGTDTKVLELRENPEGMNKLADRWGHGCPWPWVVQVSIIPTRRER